MTWKPDRVTGGKIMEIKKENGKVIISMSFSECFFGYHDPDLSKEIINRFDEILLYPNQPERLNPEDHFRDATKMVCDSPISENK